MQAAINDVLYIYIYASTPDTGNLVIWTPFFYRSAHRCPRKEKLHENTVHVRPHASFQLPDVTRPRKNPIHPPDFNGGHIVFMAESHAVSRVKPSSILASFFPPSTLFTISSYPLVTFEIRLKVILSVVINPIRDDSCVEFNNFNKTIAKSWSHFVVGSLGASIQRKKEKKVEIRIRWEFFRSRRGSSSNFFNDIILDRGEVRPLNRSHRLLAFFSMGIELVQMWTKKRESWIMSRSRRLAETYLPEGIV